MSHANRRGKGACRTPDSLCRTHNVRLMQQTRGNPKYRDLVTALGDIDALGARATRPRLRPAGTVASPQR